MENKNELMGVFGGEVVELSNDINVITSEIKYLEKAKEGMNKLFDWEIGRRLKHVKENILVDNKAKQNGEWAKWCEDEFGKPRQYADKQIKIYTELEAEYSGTQLGWKKLYEIATLPQNERKKEHTFYNDEKNIRVENKVPDEMTVKELQELKKQLKQSHIKQMEIQTKNDELKSENAKLENTVSNLQSENCELESLLDEEMNKEPKVIEKVIEVEKEMSKEQLEYVQNLQQKVYDLEEENGKLKEQNDKLNYEKVDPIKNDQQFADDVLTNQLLQMTKDMQQMIDKYKHLKDIEKGWDKVNKNIFDNFASAFNELNNELDKLGDTVNQNS